MLFSKMNETQKLGKGQRNCGAWEINDFSSREGCSSQTYGNVSAQQSPAQQRHLYSSSHPPPPALMLLLKQRPDRSIPGNPSQDPNHVATWPGSCLSAWPVGQLRKGCVSPRAQMFFRHEINSRETFRDSFRKWHVKALTFAVISLRDK